MTATCRFTRLNIPAYLTLALLSAAGAGPVSAAETAKNVTFAKDVAPILQEKCQVCHRPGTIAPMSLQTYEEVRPWARAIKQRTTRREMPPWSIDRTVGIQEYKDDPSLSDEEIAVISGWVDAGAPLGDPKQMPPPKQFHDDDEWALGKPDLIVTIPEEVVMYAKGPDWWPEFVTPSGMTEDRYIKSIETRPSRTGRKIAHHGGTWVIQEPDPFLKGAGQVMPDGREETRLSEYVTGKRGDTFPEGAGRLLKKGADIHFQMHYHAIGEETRDRTSVGFVFYPKGYVPKYISRWLTMGDANDLDVAPNALSRTDNYYRLPKPTRIDGYQPHMHQRGKAQCLEAIYPAATDTKVNTRGGMPRETLACVDRFDFNWQLAYAFKENAAPLLPEGTILHTISIQDNTSANKYNPDPGQWVGWGDRTVDEMVLSHIPLTFLEDEDYNRLVAERKALKLKQVGTASQQQQQQQQQ